MSLQAYRRRRDFTRTPEPRGGSAPNASRRFVVQKHAARKLHFDFRLQCQGVLKSWAVPKGPAMDPAVRSLAVQVEDHPLEYASFEGIIPTGQYGGGTVMVWDQGTWQPLDKEDPEQALRRGKLRFRLDGQRLKGEWNLVRLRSDDDGSPSWLLIKRRDAHARPGEGHAVAEKERTSVVTGRTMRQIAEAADRVWNADQTPPENADALARAALDLPGATRRHAPSRLAPQLATLARQVPKGQAWLHELKWDGYRILAHCEADGWRLRTRRGEDWTADFPEVREALERLPLNSAILDGEIVLLNASGVSDFQALQNSRKRPQGARQYYVFDLPFCQGVDLRRVPLRDRKELLGRLVPAEATGTLRFSDHIPGQGEKVLDQACRLGAEGIVSKRADSTYTSRRTRDWLKVKCIRQQDFVIGGFTEPQGSRKGLGALLLGSYDSERRLIYRGRVGTGMDQQSLQHLRSQLDPLRTGSPPFTDFPGDRRRRGIIWVKPVRVATVAYADQTRDGLLRHATFRGLQNSTMATKKTSSSVTIAGVTLSNPDRVLYPAQGLTKASLARYYESVGPWILPHVVHRPLTLVRCPRGWQSKCFYQKHINESLPTAIRGVDIQETDEVRKYMVIDDLAGLISLVQMGVLEIHPWGCREDRIESPDRMILDLDPGEDVEWEAVVEAAYHVRDFLDELGLTSFLRTTGGKGLHVVVPLARRHRWDQVKEFSEAVAKQLAADRPDRYVATVRKTARKGKIYVDYLRNSRGATAIASYSTRARAGAPVATPLDWDELARTARPDSWNIQNVPERLAHLASDPWPRFDQLRQSLTRAMRQQLAT